MVSFEEVAKIAAMIGTLILFIVTGVSLHKVREVEATLQSLYLGCVATVEEYQALPRGAAADACSVSFEAWIERGVEPTPPRFELPSPSSIAAR
jgi:hypothetical protein